MDTSTVSLSQLLFNGRYYKVPKFQRDYSWREENWEDLWEDIINIYSELESYIKKNEQPDVVHYMGSVIFRRTNDPDLFEIIDGQQRLVSIIMIGLAGIKFLKELVEQGVEVEANQDRIQTFERYFVGSKDEVGLFFKNKLELNKNDNLFFKEKILRYQKPILSKLRYSQKLLYRSYEYFYNRIKEFFSKKNDRGEFIAFLLAKIIGNRLIFTQILVEDVLSAYSVFETLNARGIVLAPTDLLKNYLFSLIKVETDIDILEEKWNSIVDRVGFEHFPTFLRYYLNSYKPLVRARTLFKDLRKIITTGNEVLNFLDKLEEVAYLYQALHNPADEFWNDFEDKHKIIRHVEALKLFKVTQYIPLVFAVYKSIPKLIEAVLRIVKIISFRYSVISGLNTNEMEKVFNETAIKIYKKEIKTAKEIFNELAQLYIDDKRFKTNFEIVEIKTKRNKALVKYILTEIENEITNGAFDYTDSSITIEHILPENLSEDWYNMFKSKEITRYLYRLGNLTLLEASFNRQAANLNFYQKIRFYKKSKFALTKEIAEKYDKWDEQAISKRQQRLADIAAKVWRLDF